MKQTLNKLVSNAKVNKPCLVKTQLKTKFKINTQPGLTRYEWENDGPLKDTFHLSKIIHGSNAQELVTRIPPIEVDDDVALCLGVGESHYGHPAEFIQLNTRRPEIPNVCKYCGLRYVMKQHKH